MTDTQERTEMYDTLDDLCAGRMESVEALHESLITSVSDAVGVVIAGQCVLSDPSEGYWGRALCLISGENIQVRICPRGSAGNAISDGETRIIAVRRTCSGLTVPQVAFAILFNPVSSLAYDSRIPLSSARTTGCRAIQLLLPSLFSLHDPHRDVTRGHPDIDINGFHTVRPCTLSITNHVIRDKRIATFSASISPGESYLVIGGHLCGVNVPDPLGRSAVTVSDREHRRKSTRLTRMISNQVGEDNAKTSISSALTLIELLSAEGIIGMLCHTFFSGLLPDMIHSPVGMVLCIVMASRIACYPEQFGLPACTPQDAYANREVCMTFESKWEPVVSNGLRAIDVAIKSGRDNAYARSEHEKAMKPFIRENLEFWQRVGQRINTKISSDPHDDRYSTASKHRCETRFGKADLLWDPVTEAKYAFMAKKNLAAPVCEASVRVVSFASRGDMRTTFSRMYDTVETWLRDGTYGSVCLSNPNVNTTSKMSAASTDDIISSDENKRDDENDVLDFKLCQDAMESAAGVISVSMLHGGHIFHQFGIDTFVVSNKMTNLCADCDESVGVLDGVLFKTRSSECSKCNRRRCFKCTNDASTKLQIPTSCRRCDQEAPKVRTNLSSKH